MSDGDQGGARELDAPVVRHGQAWSGVVWPTGDGTGSNTRAKPVIRERG